MARGVSAFCFLATLLAAVIAAPQECLAAEEVDLELVLATDVSRSIVEEEALLQRQGVAAAFRSAEVIRAIQNGALQRIAVAYIDWSNDGLNRIVVDWQLIKGKPDAEAFADALLAASVTYGNRTSISSALLMATDMLQTNPYEGTRRVIDISGDGKNNMGLSLAPVREEVLAQGIVINGLPIIVENAQFAGNNFVPDIDKYYHSCVIGGRGAFLIVARGFKDFATAIRHKLVLEISDLRLPLREEARVIPAAATTRLAQVSPNLLQGPAIMRAPAQRETDCDAYGAFGGFGGFR
jgi:hypothetical protein